ncbi:meiotic recombination protein REC114 [Esox lucius]|nr:meiotic recombination protein REC114 [Esox lucius]
MSEPSSENAGDLLLTIVESGHMLVSLGQELLDGFSLLDAPSFLKAQQHSDTLFLRLTVKGESRLVRMQFDGSSKAEALEECGSAVLRLKEYLPVTTKRGLAPAQPPPSQPTTQAATLDLQAVKTGPEIVQGSLSIARLTQHFLGEHALSLPLMYRHSTLRPGELEPFLRLCLLDPSFPAWVEEVEGELTRALQD